MPATYESIATTTLASNQTTVTLSSIPATFTDLVLVVSSQGTRATLGGDMNIVINGDTGNNYSITTLSGNGTSAASSRFTNLPALALGPDLGPASTSTYTPTIIHFMNYSNTTTNKTVISRHNNAGQRVFAIVGLWRSTAAINSLSLTAGGYDYVTGSTFTLYGIKAA